MKKMVNHVPNKSKKYHQISSYLLKTILFMQVELKENWYWEQEFVFEIFFRDLMEKLIKCSKECIGIHPLIY